MHYLVIIIDIFPIVTRTSNLNVLTSQILFMFHLTLHMFNLKYEYTLEEMVYSKIAKEISKHIVDLCICIFKFLKEHEIFQLFQVVCYILWHKGKCLNNRCLNILGLL